MRRVAFITSNGTGLGHVTRCLAIARRLPDDVEPLLVTHSLAAPTARGLGVEVEHWPSHGAPAIGSEWHWGRRLGMRVRELLLDVGPEVVVFDGVRPYLSLVDALEEAWEVRSVWLRRAMWRPRSGAASLALAERFDCVLEPGEAAASWDRGPTARLEAERLEPVVLPTREEMLDRREAARELGLDPERRLALLSLGGGGGVAEASSRALEALAGRDDVQVAALESTLSPAVATPPGVVALRGRYPMAHLLGCFDLAVAAAGYNQAHELLAAGVPSLLVPIDRETDDQRQRARGLEEMGLALAVEGASDPSLPARLEELCSGGGEEVRERLGARGHPEGAREAAERVAALARGAPPPKRARRSAIARHLLNLRSRWRSTAAAPLQRARAHHARLVLLGEGVPSAEIAEAVESALEREAVEPAGAVVVVDDLESLAALEGLGVGVEHVPTGGGMRDPARHAERLEAALAERPGPPKIVDVRDG